MYPFSTMLKTNFSLPSFCMNTQKLARFMKHISKLFGILLLVLISTPGFSQKELKNDSIVVRQLFDEALLRGKSHDDLRELCKDIGARLSGSSQAEMAVLWAEAKMKAYGLENVTLQPVMVPHWERGTKESAWYRTKTGEFVPVKMVALGGSIGTNGTLKAEVIEFISLDALKKASRSQVEGKIVFLNQPMNPADITTFSAYGGCYAIRGQGAVEASKLGAVGVVIRSLALPQDDFPHTGSMHYEAEIEKIPAGALSTNSANLLSEALQGGKIEFIMEMDCKDFPDVQSYNVMGEITGSKYPEKVITVGGHLDSWDQGEGAHDDGAGVIHSMEALRIMKVLKIKPQHTIRVVFFMNEENGNKGGIGYAQWVKEKGEQHIAALESDRGGFAPRGFECDGSEAQLKLIQNFAPLLKPYELHHFEKGYGGVDIGPLKKQFEGIPLYGFVPDSQRYFDFHHADSDVFESVNKRELELGAASVAAFLYLLDLHLQ